jgi:hypothetical protein
MGARVERDIAGKEAGEQTAPKSSSSMPIAIWMGDGRVCVAVIEEPRHYTSGMCRCGGCHASQHADLAERFFP